jgi:hypothetical protein
MNTPNVIFFLLPIALVSGLIRSPTRTACPALSFYMVTFAIMATASYTLSTIGKTIRSNSVPRRS